MKRKNSKIHWIYQLNPLSIRKINFFLIYLKGLGHLLAAHSKGHRIKARTQHLSLWKVRVQDRIQGFSGKASRISVYDDLALSVL